MLEAGVGSRDVLADEKNANGYCGSRKMVNTCGFQNVPAWCFTSVSTGIKQCIHGFCVCTQLAGCREPTCTPNAQQQCTNGQKPCIGGCITAPGSGWECWHPCNYGHQSSDFGDSSNLVNYIRTSTRTCDALGGPPRQQAPQQQVPQQQVPSQPTRSIVPQQQVPQQRGPYQRTPQQQVPAQQGPWQQTPRQQDPWGQNEYEPEWDCGIKLTYMKYPFFGSTEVAGKSDLPVTGSSGRSNTKNAAKYGFGIGSGIMCICVFTFLLQMGWMNT